MDQLLSYLFGNPGSGFRYYAVLISLYSIVLIAAIVTSRYLKHARRTNNPIAKNLFSGAPAHFYYLSFAGFATVIFRYENVPFFSMRALMFVVLILTILFLGKHIYNYYMIYPQERAKYEKRPTQDRYLPKKKKRK